MITRMTIKCKPQRKIYTLWRFKGRQGLFLQHVNLNPTVWLLHMLFPETGMLFPLHNTDNFSSPLRSQLMVLPLCRDLPWPPITEETSLYNLSQLLVYCGFSSKY